nr:hypothetical protein OH820_15115 [Streptomyces sp. NBC_00857]
MALAPLPDHNRTDDPHWQKLFHGYRNVITPLRRNGWVTDVDCLGYIRADLGDGTELIIGATHELPTDPSELDGWAVVRQSTETVQAYNSLYDSTPDGPQRHHGTSLVPMLTRLGELDACKTTERLYVSASSTTPHGVAHNQTGPVEKPGTAVGRYFEWSQRLNDGRCSKVWERPEQDGLPLAIFEGGGHVVTVRVTPWRD